MSHKELSQVKEQLAHLTQNVVALREELAATKQSSMARCRRFLQLCLRRFLCAMRRDATLGEGGQQPFVLQCEFAFPPALARALMLKRTPIEEVIQFAASQYVDVERDSRVIEQIAETVPDEADRNELLVRFRRQIALHRKNLQQLGVTVHDVAAGDPFKPDHHEPVGYQEADDAEKHDTVFTSDSPLFVWKDEWNQDQVIPAQVVLFRRTADDPVEGNGHTSAAIAHAE